MLKCFREIKRFDNNLDSINESPLGVQLSGTTLILIDIIRQKKTGFKTQLIFY